MLKPGNEIGAWGYMLMFSQSEGKNFNNCTPLFKYTYLLTLILLFLVENSF